MVGFFVGDTEVSVKVDVPHADNRIMQTAIQIVLVYFILSPPGKWNAWG